MKVRESLSTRVFIMLTCALLSLTSCKNNNLFGKLHDRGDSNNPTSLTTEGSIALRNKDYAGALALYQKVLDQDPGNSQALYGASAAALGTAGINLGSLIANFTKQQAGSSGASITSLTDLVRRSRESIAGPPQAGGVDSLLEGINLVALDGVIDVAVCRLQKIVSGQADGKIPPNDIDVLLNLGTLCAMRAVVKPLLSDFLDIANPNGSFNIVPKTDFKNAFCNSHSDLIKKMARDIVGSYACFNKAADLLHLSGDEIIRRVRSDLDEAINELLVSGGATKLPTDCITILSAINITPTTFTSNTEIFSPNWNGC